MLSPSCYYGWRGFSSENLLLETLPRIAEQRGNEKSIFNYMFSRSRRVVENVFGILIQKIQIYQRTLQSLPENTDNIIFATCILHSYLRDQDVGLSDMGSSANDQSNLTKVPKHAGSAQWSAFEVGDKFKQIFNSPSGSVPWQNERVQC